MNARATMLVRVNEPDGALRLMAVSGRTAVVEIRRGVDQCVSVTLPMQELLNGIADLLLLVGEPRT